MYTLVYRGLVPLLILLLCAPELQAQKKDKIPAEHELHLGFGFAREVFNPRIMYKLVRGDRALRLTLQLDANSSGTSTGPDFINPNFNFESSNQNFFAQIGIGREQRKPLGEKFGILYGGTFRLSYGTQRNRNLSTEWENQVRVDTENVLQSTELGAGFHTFAGFFWKPVPRLTISLEAGPSASGSISSSRNYRLVREYNGSVPVDSEFSDRNLDGFRMNLSLFSPVFIQAGFTF
ncbi:MAG: hypothetical protein AAGN35_05155 [Bacteroidota bacterium]